MPVHHDAVRAGSHRPTAEIRPRECQGVGNDSRGLKTSRLDHLAPLSHPVMADDAGHVATRRKRLAQGRVQNLDWLRHLVFEDEGQCGGPSCPVRDRQIDAEKPHILRWNQDNGRSGPTGIRQHKPIGTERPDAVRRAWSLTAGDFRRIIDISFRHGRPLATDV